MAKKQNTSKEKDTKPAKKHKPLWRRILSVIGLVLLIVIVITVVVGGILDLADLHVRKTSSQTNSFAFTGSTLNLLDLTSGTVNIERGQSKTIVIERTVTQGIRKTSTSERVSGDTFVVRQSGCGGLNFGLFGLCTSNFTIKVPANVAVTVRDSNGNVNVSNIEGDLNIQADGKITADHITDKAITLHSGDSDVAATNVQTDSLDASTGGGKVNINHATVSDAMLSSNDSDVSVANTKSTSINATSGGGKVIISHVTGKLILHSSDSDVTATDITSSLVDATSGGGKVSLGFISIAPNTIVAHSDDSDISIVLPHNAVAYKTNATSKDSTTTVNIKTDPDNTKNTIDATSGGGKVSLSY